MKFGLKNCLFILLFLALPFGIRSQEVNLEVSNQPLSEVLELLVEQYDLHFSYEADLLKDIRTSIQADQEDIEAFLIRLLSPFQLSAQRNGSKFFYIQSKRRSIVFMLEDEENQSEVPFATLFLKDSYSAVTANDRGFAKFRLDREKDTALVVRSIGYQSQEIDPRTIQGDSFRIRMQPAPVLLETFTITEYINRGIRLNADIASAELRLDEMEVLPGLPEADALLSAQMLPGFESNSETASGINVRGGDQAQTLLYWDRIPVYQPAHYFGQITSIIPSMTQRINAYKNYIPTSFTGATSGLLDMHSVDTISGEHQVTSNTNFTHTDLSYVGDVNNKLSVALGGRYSYNHLISTPLFEAYSEKLFDGTIDPSEDDVFDIVDDLRFWDINAKLIYQPNAKHYFSISTLFNQDNLDHSGTNREDSSISTINHHSDFSGVNAFYSYQIDEDWSASFSLSFTKYSLEDVSTFSFQSEEEVDFDSSIVNNNLRTMEAKLATHYKGWESVDLEFGAQRYRYNNELSFAEQNEFEGGFSESRESNERSTGIYSLARIKLGEKSLLSPQFRLDYFDREEELLFNPVINYQYQISKGYWLKTSVGQYAQALSAINEFDFNVSNVNSSIWVLAGDDDTEVLQSQMISIGGLIQRKGWVIDLDVYGKEVNNVPVNNLLNVTVRDNFEFFLGTIESYGIDLMVKKNFGKYHSWLSYTFSETSITFEGDNTFPSSLDRPHQLRFVNTLLLGQFELSLGYIFKSGAPYSRAASVAYDDVEDDYFIVYESINGSRLDHYQRFDFSCWYRFPNRSSKVKGMLGLSLMNFTGRYNIWKRFYFLEDPDNDDDPEIIQEERYFLGFTPNISLRLNF